MPEKYEYIYDPDHKKHPGGGYTKTEKGWQKGKKEEDKEEKSKSTESVSDEFAFNPDKDDYHEMAEKIESVEDSDKLAKLAEHETWQVRKMVAHNKHTSPETLAKLAKDENYNVRCLAALNDNTPDQSLIDLCSDENKVVKSFVAIAKLPKEGELKLIQDPDAQVRHAFAMSENASKDALTLLAKDKKKIVLEGVAHNKHTPVETLEKLAMRKDKDIRNEVAGNENASSSVLSYIYNHIPYDEVKSYGKCARSIAYNGNASPELLEQMFNDSADFGDYKKDVETGVASNKNTPGSILEKILKDGNDFQKYCAKTTCQKKYNNESVYLDEEGQEYFIDQLEEEYDDLKKSGDTEAKDFNEYFSNATSGNGNLHELKYEKEEKKPEQTVKKTKKTIVDVVKGLDNDKKKKVVTDQQAPSKVLDILSDDEDENIRAFVSLNKNTSVETLNKLGQDKSEHVRNMIVFNQNCPLDILRDTAENGSQQAKLGVTMNTNTTPEIYAKMIKKDNDSTVRDSARKEWKKKRQKDMTDEQKKIDDEADNKYNWDSPKLSAAMNEKAHPETLRMLSLDDNINIRGRVGENPSTPVDVLERLSKDVSSSVRDWIAYNPNCPVNILETLSKDPDKTVSSSAQMALSKKQSQTTGQKADNLPKFKFKGDDKTAPIIRSKFEKEHDEEETNTIYGEMAKFSKEDVAPMGVYHGRSKEQLKADFIKNMNPANYSSPEAFQSAKKRVQQLSAQDFSRMLASIFADEEETEEVK